MIIQKAKRKDLEEYLRLRKETLREYYKIKEEKILISDEKIKKEFLGLLNTKKRILLIAKENKQILGYLMGTILRNVWQKVGYLDDVLVKKDFRNKKIGSKLIKKFIKILNKKGIKKVRLGVDVKNKKAILLYKKLGFKIAQYEMSK
ncbi:GNAT family N-acetyltransferase [Candidatus Pacearchaeota archaeon]|jgi:ribosomal protein S18 acetylase RimI-like enzyme|nr:GNAT family N-acetyltransferase [Candidatus Pacearchaeota archaeon]